MKELAKAYEPSLVEDRLYADWIQSNAWKANEHSSKPPFSIVMPPPNITGVLTLGHVLNNSIQDILCRKARMDGKEVLWLPGTDHAGLATQTAVEKSLRKNENKTRFDLGREEFLRVTWEWQKTHGGIIIQQLKKLGCSADWSRERFTLDADYSKAVQEVFVTLYNRGLIYRGKRMVNWCPGSQTAISDEEVIPKPQKGKLYYVRYELAETPGEFLIVATTRPETIPADWALAVHPEDERYAHLIGKQVYRPLSKALIPIIPSTQIDKAFGTGVLKVTPAHDKVDLEIYLQDKKAINPSDFKCVINEKGFIDSEDEAELHQLERFKARVKSEEILQARERLEKTEDYQNNVGFSERADVPIEPRLSDQWFLRYPKAEEALKVVREHLIRFFPEHHEKVYQHWLENIQDWCISRQVWWGHRVPVWNKDGEIKCQIESPGAGWEQDPDTLDTWFSSWLWAYETMDNATRKKFYPTSILVTGPDIIFLWVARMIIAGLEFQPGKDASLESNLAFRDVYFTGLIRDRQGRKMSKSLGNSPNPLDLISTYGADGIRFGLMRIAPQGQDIRFDEKQIEEGRNFCNKLWNSARFRSMQGELNASANPYQHSLTPFSQLLLEQLDQVIRTVSKALDQYEFSLAASTLYDFVWNDFCSNFIESAKADFYNASSPTREGTLATVDFTLSRVLRLLHPFAPFVTEELWLELGLGKSTIQFAEWPKSFLEQKPNPEAQKAQEVYNAVSLGRALRGEFNLPSSQKFRFLLKPKIEIQDSVLEVFGLLLNASLLERIDTALAKTPVAFTTLGDLYLPLEGILDPEKESQRLEKELQKVMKDLEITQKKLDDPHMLSKAPAEKIAEWKQLKEDLSGKFARVQEQIAIFR